MDLRGLTVGMIGRMRRTAEGLKAAKKVYIFELAPKEGDLPASEEDRLLPECDIVIVTGTSIINHTIEHIFELAQGARVILLGPSVPMLPALRDFGAERLSGLCVTRQAECLPCQREGDRPQAVVGFTLVLRGVNPPVSLEADSPL
jgi:uncharacterized protein (DUF4213/DUF364 family)